jgi:cyanate permease
MAAHAVTCLVAAGVWVAVDQLVAGANPVPATPTARPLGGRAAARDLLGSRDVRLAIALGAGAFFITQGLATWLPDILRETSGMSPAAASNWAAASMAIGIFARLVIPGSARPERRSLVLQICMATLVVALLVLAFGPQVAGITAVLVLGLRSALNSLVILVLMEADRVTAGNAGLATGLWFSAVQVGGAGGPLLPGALGDTRYGFAAALAGMAAMLLVMMGILARHDRHRPAISGGTG